ncbi:hypothetical protein [Melghirimyces algeriensis]|uniref:Uncharacterized protein n=1 Tax=Melghirimyces algeriensis TaxID=910412 RepID=A0A521CR08_9BACL|nr:hypothetical protein [Melghirimyces algeriensis]SMO61882.1 hypothetical protein SAMN06264849_104140 [Melghirimyces algeriensis]
MIEKLADHEPINAKGKFKKRSRMDTKSAWTPESIDTKVEQAVKSHNKERSRKEIV